MHSIRIVLLLMLSTLVACSDRGSSSIADQLSASAGKSVDLAVAVAGNWDRVCILGPYSSNAVAAGILGFEWPAESLTDVERSDVISLLVFVQGSTVLEYLEHPRSSGDFSNLAGRCFLHGNTKFRQVDQPIKGWAGLFPADEA